MAPGFLSLLIHECGRLFTRFAGSGRQAFFNAVTIALVAAGLPWLMGMEFMKALVIIPMSCLGVFLVADLVAESFFSHDSSLDERAYFARIFACVLVGWTGSLATVGAGLAVVNAIHWEGEWQLPPNSILIDAALLSLAVSAFVAGAAVCVARQSASARSARLMLRMVMLVSTVVLMYGCSRALITGRIYLSNERITRATWMASTFLLANGGGLIVYGAGLTPRK
jgi:hypothetical protein